MDTQLQPPTFEAIWSYRPLVHGLCLRNMRNQPDPVSLAEDLTQNVMMKAYRAREGFRGEAKLDTWLYRIALNECTSFMRAQGKRNQASLSLEDVIGIESLESDLVESETFGSEDPESVYLRRISAQRTAQQLQAQMDPVWVEIFGLLEKGWTYEDTCRYIGWSLGRFKKQLHLMRKRLRLYLQQKTASL